MPLHLLYIIVLDTFHILCRFFRFSLSLSLSLSLSFSRSLSLSLLSRKIFVGGLSHITTDGAFFLLLSCADRMYTIYRIGDRFLRLCRWSGELLLRLRWSHRVFHQATREEQQVKVRECSLEHGIVGSSWQNALCSLSCRGFGFVTFRDPDVVQIVLNQKEHFLDDWKVSTTVIYLFIYWA